MKVALVLGLGLLTAASADPSSVSAPSFKAGDTWVFDQIEQRGTNGFGEQRIDLAVERTDGDTMLVGIKRDGAPTAYEDHVLGRDWSQRHLVDGQEVSTTRPLSFPMRIGQQWHVDFADSTRRGLQTALHVRRLYSVKGWEDVTVPAGTFHAIKIEATGTSEAVIVTPSSVASGAAVSPFGGGAVAQSHRGGTAVRTVRDLDQFYYVPTVNNWVKSVEEQYNGEDVLVSRNTRELVSYRPAP